ncbi:MAG: hypothetical protein IT385_08580 [Deltaproteobacteria bacterium]|nr:hypothetical protein [Deltaproteobacteria bacterium]
MRTLLIVLTVTTLAACGKKPVEKPAEPTKVAEADVPAKPSEADVPAKPAEADVPAKPSEADTAKPGGDEPDAVKPAEPPAPTSPPIAEWMSWEGGVDIVGMTKEGLPGPNVIFHIARLVHTPLGSAASGMILYQPDPEKPPVVAGFVSTDATVGAYFGPKIFAGTPFEQAPASVAEIEVKYDPAEKKATSRCKIGDNVFEAELSDIGDGYLINRAPAQMTPFHQQGVEAKVGKVVFKVNGAEVPLVLPPVGITGGPAAVFAATGVYAR